MKRFWFGCLLLVFVTVGCTTDSQAKKRARAAFVTGQRSGAALAQRPPQQPPTVSVLGEVRQQIIPWTEGLTLAQAIVTAEHIGHREPKAIVLHRGEETVTLKTFFLYQAGLNLLLEPGDVIELVR